MGELNDLDRIRVLIRQPQPSWTAYDAGYDCGVNGASERNCHISFFGSRASTKEWERGKAAGDAAKGSKGGITVLDKEPK